MNQLDLLHNRHFLPLFLTQFLGAFNDNVYKNALVIFIAFTQAGRSGDNASVLVILAGGVFILPFFLFSAVAGQVADRYEKALLIRWIKSAEILIMGIALGGFLLQDIVVLMITLFLMGAQSTFFGPLKYGILPQHLAETELVGGNGLIQMGTYLAILGGTILGGVLVAIGERGPAVTGIVVILVACLGRLSSSYIPPAAASDPTLRLDWNPARQTMIVMQLAARPLLQLVTILAISWFWLVGATFLSLIPTYVRDVLHGDEYVATLLLTAFSVGIGSGSVLCERFSRGHIEPGLVLFGAAGISLLATDMYFLDPAVSAVITGAAAFLSRWDTWHVLIDLALIGFFGGIYIVPLYAMLQHRSDPHQRARVIAANNICNALFMVVSAIIVIALVKAGYTPQQIFLCTAVATVATLAAIARVMPELPRRTRVLLLELLPGDARAGG